MLRRDAQGGQLHLVLNWTEEVKRILARGGVRWKRRGFLPPSDRSRLRETARCLLTAYSQGA